MSQNERDDAMTDTITITYWEGDESKTHPLTKLYYAEWTRNGIAEYAHADEELFTADPRDNEVRGIPDDVRETLALLIAPSLKAKLNVKI